MFLGSFWGRFGVFLGVLGGMISRWGRIYKNILVFLGSLEKHARTPPRLFLAVMYTPKNQHFGEGYTPARKSDTWTPGPQS
jgi:hypothetical protein